MTTTGDIAPVMVTPAPSMMAKRRKAINRPAPSTRPKAKRKSAVESIIGRALNEEINSLIPDDAEDLLTADEVDAKEKAAVDDEPAGGEALLQPALALVAPDTTPNAAKELDPSLVPDRDPAMSTLLGDEPTLGPLKAKNPGPVQKTTVPVLPKRTESKESITESLPSTEMPRPPGEFFRSIGDITGEGKSETPKVELIVGSGSNPVQASMTDGQLGESMMPTPKEANIDKTMDAFRRFHRVQV